MTEEITKEYAYALTTPFCNCKSMKEMIDEATNDLATQLRGTDCPSAIRMKLELQLVLMANIDYAIALSSGEWVPEGDDRIRDAIAVECHKYFNGAKNIVEMNQLYCADKINNQLHDAYVHSEHVTAPPPEMEQ